MRHATDSRNSPIAAWCVAAVALLALAWFTPLVLPISLLVDRLRLPIALAAATLLACIGWGSLIRLVRRAAVDEPHATALARELIVGLPIFGTVAFMVGTITTAPAVMSALLLASSAVGVAAMLTLPRVPVFPGERSRGSVVLLLAAGAALLQVFAVAQLPAISLDELAYHLTVLVQGVINGRIVEQPLMSHSYFPFGSEAASLPAFALLRHGAALASHFTSMGLAAATLVFCYQIVRRRTSARAASMATLCLLATPPMLVTAGWTWTDWPVLGAVLVMFDALDRDEVKTGDLGLAIAAGLLTKYTFVVPAGALILARVVATREFDRRLIRAVVLGGLGGAYFYVRNLVLNGNPVAPLLGSLAPAVSGFRKNLGPLATFRSYVFDPGIQDEALGVALLLLVIAGLATIWSAPVYRRAAFFVALAGAVAMALLLPSSRILVPSLAIVGVVGAMAFFTTASGRAAMVVSGLLAVIATLQLLTAAIYLDSLGAFAVVAGQKSEGAYLATIPLYQESQWANELLPEKSKTLVVGLNALFWFDRPVRGAGNFDGPRVNAFFESGTAAELYTRLRGEGFTHVAIFDRGFTEWQGTRRERATNLSPRAQATMKELIYLYTTRVKEEGVRHLFALK